MRLVYFLVNKHYNYLVHDEDIIQEGMVGLLKACRTWDPSKTKFSTYAATCIINEIRMELRRRNKESEYNFISINDTVVDEGDFSYIEVIPDTRDYIEDSEFMSMFQDAFETLKDDEKEIINLLKEGYTQRYVSNKMKCSQPRIYRIKKKLLSKLQ